MDFKIAHIEEKWRKYWEENRTYRVTNQSDKPKFYVLDMFPYPSGSGLHVGHPLGYIASDIFARYKRLRGYNVLHPMGFDAFGLPAEQYAIQTGVHPAESTARNIARYKSQLQNLGLSYDWEREVITSDPDYYKWTQWIFLKLYDHYYDVGKSAARPVSELEKAFAREGSRGVEAFHGSEREFKAEDWMQMSPREKDDILMDYRLAYRKTAYVNWCEELGTVLANDEVRDGMSERGGFPVVRKPMLQWSLRITAYASRLLDDLETLEWSQSLKSMQRNWIGRSEGARVYFEVDGHREQIEIFTTRPDTIFGATFMVLAPEHPLVEKITADQKKEEVGKYVSYAKTRSERERISDTKTVSGAFTGAYALHPLTGERIPVWTSDYVLMDYGTGAIMAVPSDDARDRAFAERYSLPIIKVVDKSGHEEAGTHEKVGKMIHSGFLDGMEVEEAIEATIRRLEENGQGRRQINYKLRDANFSRQRYWGEPFPIVYDPDGVSHPMEEDQLPLELPELEDFMPARDGRSPLAKAEEWTTLENGWRRETDTMPGFAGSSWYFLRYMDAGNKGEFAGKDALDYWRDVDLYVGGTEHAVGHLLYARFWHKFLYDLGLVPGPEPFRKLINQGMIQGVIEYIYLSKEKEDGYHKFVCSRLVDGQREDEYAQIPVHVDFVKEYGSEDSHLDIESIKRFMDWRPEYKDAIFECGMGRYHKGVFTSNLPEKEMRLIYTHSEVGKMSKRYFNVVNPDDIVNEYGADCFRMYEMFLGPVEQSKPWDTQGIDGVSKFLRKFQSLFTDVNGNWLVNDEKAGKEELKILHSTIKKVGEDIERFSFNTCVSSFMVCVNELKKLNCHKRMVLEPLVVLISPFAPFLGEELWERLGNKPSVTVQGFPAYDEKYLKEDEIEYPVAINGKKRASVSFPSEASPEEIKQQVVALESVRKWIEGKEVRRIIVVPRRMINIVV